MHSPHNGGHGNATFFESDQSSNKSYTYDHMYREFVSKNGLQLIEEYNAPTHTPRPRTQLQTISTCNAEGSAAYCNGRIDDILLPKHIADIVHVPRACETMGYRSDHGSQRPWIMYDLGFLTDAIEAVKHLYTQASTQIRLPSGGSTDPIPVERGTIQGDTLSTFLFLLYLEPLLRWLHVGIGYNHILC